MTPPESQPADVGERCARIDAEAERGDVPEWRLQDIEDEALKQLRECRGGPALNLRVVLQLTREIRRWRGTGRQQPAGPEPCDHSGFELAIDRATGEESCDRCWVDTEPDAGGEGELVLGGNAGMIAHLNARIRELEAERTTNINAFVRREGGLCDEIAALRANLEKATQALADLRAFDAKAGPYEAALAKLKKVRELPRRWCDAATICDREAMRAYQRCAHELLAALADAAEKEKGK